MSGVKPKLYSMFCALFLKIALLAAELMSFGHLRAASWHHWTIICEVLRIDALNDNIREAAHNQ